jgi:hypothetical protein
MTICIVDGKNDHIVIFVGISFKTHTLSLSFVLILATAVFKKR